MDQRTAITLSRAAFLYNIAAIKKAINDRAINEQDIALVVKSNAYGHGMQEIASMAEQCPTITWLCTAGIEEALTLRSFGSKKNILVLSYLEGSVEKAVSEKIHLGVATLEDLHAVEAAAARIGQKAYVHIKVDTGMSRMGFMQAEILSLLNHAKQLPHCVVDGLFTHVCDTPNPDQRFSHKQLEIFDEVLDTVAASGIRVPYTHAQSSSALCIKPTRTYSFMRVGAAAYGIWKSQEHKNLIQKIHPDFDLKQVIEWKTHVIQIKKIPTGATVGYDRTFVAQRPTVLALAPIGYWDGYARGFSNRGTVVINGSFAPVAGIVSMNLTAFDVTDIADVKKGDEILLLADIPSLTVTDAAQKARIIANELVVHIHPNIKRTIITEHPTYSREYSHKTTAESSLSKISASD